jgi:hypothetical protein
VTEPAVLPGEVDPEVAAELRGLRLLTLEAPAVHGRVPPGLKARLRELSSRWHGARAVSMRREPVPHAYRVLFRHLGLDPDEERPPQEAAVLERLVQGAFRAPTHLHAALLVAVVETGVPVWAVDAARVAGPLEVRPARPGEQLGEGPYAHDLPRGRLVVADEDRPLGVLFGDLAPDVLPGPGTTAMRLFSVVAPGVPQLHAEEALWLAYEGVDGPLDAR